LKAICNTRTQISFTFPATPFGSNATEASLDSLSVTLNIDGSYTFDGAYTNRGDIPVPTIVDQAPPQDFTVAVIVAGKTGKAVSFVHNGNSISNAPQTGCSPKWHIFGSNPSIRQNWEKLVQSTKSTFRINNTVELGSVLSVLEDVIKDIAKMISAISSAVQIVASIAG
jgi:hypothetical protein